MYKRQVETLTKKPKLNKPILVEGLPGIGNVGKVVVDFLLDELKAKKLLTFNSPSFPHSVFINEQNLIELPSINIYYKKSNGKRPDLLFLAGDIQPIDEVSCHEFSEKVLDVFEDFNGKEIITLGGIGLSSIPKKPKVYCTGNSLGLIRKYSRGVKFETRLYGTVGHIVGVSGLLLGLAKRRNIQAISFLAETYGHPFYLGIRGAREILKIINKKLNLDINIKSLEQEIKLIEREVTKRIEGVSELTKQFSQLKSNIRKDITYIG